ncbi:MAG: NADH-quinone oxidoreductase subunit J [Blastocatellia bacterium]|nr:NADH-quinone oxidoreductase subunit J [Blastocatellia bacterium]MBL8196311.1 NADH-quinone oxidoreductase subunit J [Blastocatellia bacterium]MBN8724142.1 NADH-quinone oxidoreductase subunit J [Acidobacteriota bacterium]
MKLTGIEAVLFYLLAVVAVLFAIFMITARNAVHSALLLISTLVATAGIYLLLHAEFIAGVQILVYVGGVLVLFIFVIMLVNVKEEDKKVFTNQFLLGGLMTFLLALGMISILLQTQKANLFGYGQASEAKQERVQNSPNIVGSHNISQNTIKIGQELYTKYMLPFEIASLVLLVAIIGAIRLGRERKQEKIYD